MGTKYEENLYNPLYSITQAVDQLKNNDPGGMGRTWPKMDCQRFKAAQMKW